MIALLGIVGGLLVQQVPSTITIRSGDVATPLPVLVTRRGPMVRLDDGLQALGAAMIRSAADRYRIVVGGTEVELALGLSVARTTSSTEPLAAPPTMFEGKLLVPLALLTDVLPRVAPVFSYNASAGELVRQAPRTTARGGEVVRAATVPERAANGGGASVVPTTRPPAPRVVVVDAGHGGPDRGMKGPLRSSRKIHEADITLGVARQLRDELRRRDAQVVMTRTTDTLIALADRGKIANRAGASVFISIHVNAANPRWRNPGDARGFETYFLSEAKTEDERRVEEMENEVAKYDVGQNVEVGDPVSFILTDMLQNESLRESSDFAAVVQQALADLPHPGPNRGVKQAGFRVLVTASMPAILVEIGFGTNAAEAAYLASAAGQKKIAAAIATATIEYLDHLDRKTGAASQ